MKDYQDHPDRSPWVAFAFRWLRRLGWAVAALAVLLLVLEVIALLFIPGHSSRFLLKSELNDQPVWIDNQFFTYRFAAPRKAQPPLPITVPQTPEENAIRICLLGGSALMGYPDPSFGVGRQLELMLQARYPTQPIEIINMSLQEGNSHVLREVARDLKRLQPQVVVILTGNEEVAGPYGPASTMGRFHHSSRLDRLMVLFSRTRVSQMFVSLINRLSPAHADIQAWRDQEATFQQGRLDPDDPRFQTVSRAFRKNMDAILEEATDTAPVVIVCTVPVNLRDCAPFATSYLSDETAAQQVREELRAAIAAEASTNLVKAARLYGDIIRRHPSHAEALYRAGQMALRENHAAEAAALLSRARDTDALRLRADSRLNSIIRDCADRHDVSLLDAAGLFAIRSPQGIPGRELFLDHIHFTFEANHLLASALLNRMEFLHAFDTSPNGTVPGSGAIATDLLYSPWGHADVLDMIIQEQIRPPFRNQLHNEETLRRLKGEKAEWDARVAGISPVNTQAIFARRMASRPDDHWLGARSAWYLLKANAPARAEPAADAAEESWPHRYDIRALLALTRALEGEEAGQGIALIRGNDPNPGYYDIRMAVDIGNMLLLKQRPETARPWLEYALERDPWNSEAAIALAKTLHQLNESPAAIELLQKSIEQNPRNPLLWEEIASLYCLIGKWNMATRCFTKSEEIAPYRYERLYKWADALVRLRQFGRAKPLIERYLTVVPDDPEALALQKTILEELPQEREMDVDVSPEAPAKRFPWE